MSDDHDDKGPDHGQAVLQAVQLLSAKQAAEDLYGTAVAEAVLLSGARRAVLFVLGPDATRRPVASHDAALATQPDSGAVDLGEIPAPLLEQAITCGDSGIVTSAALPGALAAIGRHAGHAAVLYLDHLPGAIPDRAAVTARALVTQVAITDAGLAERARLQSCLHACEHERDTAHVLARTAREDLDDITHWVGHDLRTPLTSVVGYTQILLDDWPALPSDEIHSMLSTIDQSNMKMAEIIEEVLVVARLRRGDVECTALDMGDIVGQAQIRLANAIRRHDARVVAAASWPLARGYRPWIEAVWSALIRNGLEHGGTPPALELGATSQGDGSIRFWLRNNGPGLSDTDRAHLLAPASPGGNGRIKGHGMGLLLVKQVIERLDGKIGIDSSPGLGCTYYFTLPAS